AGRGDGARGGGARGAAGRRGRAGGAALPDPARRARGAPPHHRCGHARAPARAREPHASRRAGAPAAPQGARHPVTARRRPGAPRPATLIPGDGIGPEVIDAAVAVLAAAGGRIAWDVQLAGKAAFEKTGTAIPEALLASIRRTH